jgi:hypothetical protein
MNQTIQQRKSRKNVTVTHPLFPDCECSLEKLFEFMRCRCANLNEKWIAKQRGNTFFFLLRGSRRTLRVFADVKPSTGRIAGRIRISVFDRQRHRQLRYGRRKVNSGVATWRQNLEKAITHAFPTLYGD